MTSGSKITLNAAFDKKLISDAGKSARFLVVDIVAPKFAPLREAKKPALNIALVVDASASMGGERLKAAIESAVGVVNNLGADDRLSVISFSTDARVHVDGIKLDGGGRERAIKEILALEPREETDLGLGWLTGAQSVAKVMEHRKQMHNHVILLSDGHANLGLTNPVALEHHAEQLRRRGVISSCVGIGNDFSTVQLQAIADYGGGRIHYAEYPQEIIEVVMGELRELQQIVVEDIEVTITYPVGFVVENINGYPTKSSPTGQTCQMGSLPVEGKRHVIFRVVNPPGNRGDSMAFGVKCSWLWTGTHERDSCEAPDVTLTVVDDRTRIRQERDLVLSARVAEIWQSNIVRKAVDLNREGSFGKLRKYLERENRRFVRYCDGLPDTEHMIDALEKMKDVADQQWDERSRKSMQFSTYLTQTSQVDYRSLERAGWWSFLDARLKHKKF